MRSDGLLFRAFNRLKRKWQIRRFDAIAKDVLNTAPLEVTGETPTFLSQICHRDIKAYLLAIKSIYCRIGQGKVMAINDGSLTPDDVAVLRHHIPKIKIVDIVSVYTGRCPVGGTWERLTEIINQSIGDYVIQVDADTLVVGDVPEVVSCFKNNVSFLLGTDVGQAIGLAKPFASIARQWLNGAERHTVGTLAEAALDTLPESAPVYYVHASSGFAGFAKGAFKLETLETFSDQMKSILGIKWEEWGSEQISSNYILANAPEAYVLPFKRYACFQPTVEPDGRPFLHFIGSYRFDRGVYISWAKDVLRKLPRIT